MIAINTPARRGWRWRIYDDVGGMVVESRGTFRTNADALAAGQGRARQMKARSAVKFVVAEPEIDVPGLTGRSPYRIPKLLQGRVTLSRLAAVANDPRVNPKSGWLIDKRSIESYVRGLPEELQLGTRQLYNTLYREDWLIRGGGRGALAGRSFGPLLVVGLEERLARDSEKELEALAPRRVTGMPLSLKQREGRGRDPDETADRPESPASFEPHASKA